MIKSLRKFFKNQKRKGEKCERILGSSSKVDKFAQFWRQNEDDLLLVAAARLHHYESTYEFTKEELNAYRRGLSELGEFFLMCHLEREKKEQELLKGDNS